MALDGMKVCRQRPCRKIRILTKTIKTKELLKNTDVRKSKPASIWSAVSRLAQNRTENLYLWHKAPRLQGTVVKNTRTQHIAAYWNRSSYRAPAHLCLHNLSPQSSFPNGLSFGGLKICFTRTIKSQRPSPEQQPQPKPPWAPYKPFKLLQLLTGN